MTGEIPTTPAQVAIKYQDTGKKVNADPQLSLNLLKNSSPAELRAIAKLEGGTGSDEEIDALKQLAGNPAGPISPVSSPVRRT